MNHNYHLNQYATLFSEGIDSERPISFEERRAQRQATIAEDFFVSLLRNATDAVFLACPGGLSTARAVFANHDQHDGGQAVPDARFNRPTSNGFVAIAQDTSPAVLIDGYGRGLLLRWVAGRPVWWSPVSRFAGSPATAHEPQAALDLLASGSVRITLDRDYDRVATKCARHAILRGQPLQPGQKGLAALTRLHDAGFAHSVEVRDARNRLIGAAHGVASGRAFITQWSYGSTAAGADLALVILNRHLTYWNFAYHVLPQTADAAKFGLPEQGREVVQTCLSGCLAGDRRGRWLAVPELCARTDQAIRDNTAT